MRSSCKAAGVSGVSPKKPCWPSSLNRPAASDDGRCYMWGGNCWQGGIAAGRNATGPTEVAWGGVPSCYRCSSVALGHRHGFLIFEKRP